MTDPDPLPYHLTSDLIARIRSRLENYPIVAIDKELVDLFNSAIEAVRRWATDSCYTLGPDAMVLFIEAALDKASKDHPSRHKWEGKRKEWLEFLNNSESRVRNKIDPQETPSRQMNQFCAIGGDSDWNDMFDIYGYGSEIRSTDNAVRVPPKGKLCTAGEPTPRVGL